MRQFIGLLLVLIVGSAAAQTPDVALTTTSRLLFPDALLLEAAVPLPAAEVSAMTLNISVPGRPVVTVRYPEDQAYRFANEFVVADYRFRFPTDTVVAPFTEIQYRWTATLANGQRLIASGSVTYQDQRVSWQTITSAGRATLIYGDDPRFNPQTELAETSALLARLEAETGQALQVQWVIYPPNVPPICDRFAATSASEPTPRHRYFWAGAQRDEPCDLALGQRVFEANDYQLVTDATIGGFVALRRALVETAYAALWPPTTPAWFREGMIGLYVPRRVDDVGIVRQALRSRRPLNLNVMAADSATPTDTLWHAQAQTMTRYLLATSGVPPVFELARTLADYPDFATAYASVLNQPITALLPDWETWIYTEAAFLASSYSIYAATTPTPTPTLTASPTRIPPTASSTPTPAPQVTATPRPTRTRTPPTATPSPLPPEAFIIRATPTATPIPAATGVLPMDAPPGVFVGLGISALALVALIGYVLLRRR
jgi:hypothetical protein